MFNKFEDVLVKFPFEETDSQIERSVKEILAKKQKENETQEVYKKLFGCIDLTSLNSYDNDNSISEFVKKVNLFSEEHPDLQNVASVCVYPCFAEIVRSTLEDDQVKSVVVAGGFPFAQTYLEVKVAEVALAIADGAEEVDIVMPLGLFRSGDYEAMTDEIVEMKNACGDKVLKVILETGSLQSGYEIMKASLLSIYSGADFIKTSTGKGKIGATFEATYVMCKAIKAYNEEFNTQIGIKVAGGITTAQQAVQYYTIVKEILGEKWLNKDLFRIGASRLSNNLLSEIAGRSISFF